MFAAPGAGQPSDGIGIALAADGADGLQTVNFRAADTGNTPPTPVVTSGNGPPSHTSFAWGTAALLNHRLPAVRVTVAFGGASVLARAAPYLDLHDDLFYF